MGLLKFNFGYDLTHFANTLHAEVRVFMSP